MRTMERNCRPEWPLPLDFACTDVFLNRSDSDSVESCGDILQCEEKDYSKMWTDEKHSLYLEQLEISFVQKLHQSMGFLVHCSENNKRGKYTAQTRPINSHNTPEQCGCREKINQGRSNIDSGVSANSRDDNASDDPRMMPADVPELIYATEEGTGQNFVSESKSNSKGRAKRKKTG